MNKQLKTLRRKLTLFAKMFEALEHNAKRDAFTMINERGLNHELITQRERRLIWGKMLEELKKRENQR